MDKSKLLEARRKLGLTQVQMAEKLRVASNTIARWERGEMTIPDLVEVALLAIIPATPEASLQEDKQPPRSSPMGAIPKAPLVFGAIPTVVEDQTFKSYAEMYAAGVHKQPQKGIHGREDEGAASIVASDEYEDDKYDPRNTDVIIYTGEGGRGPKGKQIKDQKMEGGNLALARNKALGLPVRVVRGNKSDENAKYIFKGLYYVDEFWYQMGKSGHYVWLYRLIKLSSLPGGVLGGNGPVPPSGPGGGVPGGNAAPPRVTYGITRVVRDTALSVYLKKKYDYTCSVCGVRLVGGAGPYVEAAHIQPLGRPHNGPDVVGNIVVLCPNHHAVFDLGGFTINDDLTLTGIDGKLTLFPDHKLDLECLKYRREHFVRGI